MLALKNIWMHVIILGYCKARKWKKYALNKLNKQYDIVKHVQAAIGTQKSLGRKNNYKKILKGYVLSKGDVGFTTSIPIIHNLKTSQKLNDVNKKHKNTRVLGPQNWMIKHKNIKAPRNVSMWREIKDYVSWWAHNDNSFYLLWNCKRTLSNAIFMWDIGEFYFYEIEWIVTSFLRTSRAHEFLPHGER